MSAAGRSFDLTNPSPFASMAFVSGCSGLAVASGSVFDRRGHDRCGGR
jgi:hypothetical protein